MKTHIIFWGFLVVFCFTGILYGNDWDIYSDAVIEDGDDYWTVRVYDSPPDHTTVDMTGGSANVIQTYDVSTLNMSGGITEVSAHDESTINMSGGTIYTLRAGESSTANVFGGFVNSLHSWDVGIVNVWGEGDVFAVDTREEGIVNISGGTIDRVRVLELGIVNLSGGILNDSLYAGDSGIIYVYGKDLFKFPIGGEYNFGYVYGEWHDGTGFNIDFGSSETYSHVVLIPEPSAVLLLVTGSILFKRRKR